MRALIVGLGSIGKRHLQNLRTIMPAAEITVWRQHQKLDNDATLHPQASRFVYSLEDALNSRPEIAIIANPASQHIETAQEIARAGASLLIEKPISNRIEAVRDLIEYCSVNSLVLMVGYSLRFQPALQALVQQVREGSIGDVLCLQAEVGQYLPEWRPERNYTESVSAQRQLGGGVVLELSHELDYTRWLMGEVRSVSAQTRKLSNLALDVEDTANIQLAFTSGALGNLHLNMIQRNTSRTCKLVGTEGSLLWNGLTGEVSQYSANAGKWQQTFSSSSTDRNEMFINELKHFLTCVTSGLKPSITGEDGLRVLEIALAVHESSWLQRTVVL